MRRSLVLTSALALLSVCAAGAVGAQQITPQAAQLMTIIDSLDVEHHWPAGQHVSWQSGVPDGRPESAAGKHTHCSAFAAAAAERVGIYLLRPPEHAQLLLANAQYDWLATDGVARGWQPVSDALEAQHLANRGSLVVAVYKNHLDDKPGHIAIVRADGKDARLIREEGPQVTQAGGTNYRSVSLQQGFAGHPAAWGQHEVKFYAHSVSAQALAAPSH
jgi:hypothetical protein